MYAAISYEPEGKMIQFWNIFIENCIYPPRVTFDVSPVVYFWKTNHP